ncbi:aminotransferase class I/II-fold pyridoxal phosphate-dependent enzyme [Myroides sp. LJL119]
MRLLNSVWQNLLEDKKHNGAFRELEIKDEKFIDFYSNDYLGFATDQQLQYQILKDLQRNPDALTGSKGSRLITGSSLELQALENYIAQMHQFESALFFQSGYTANLALFSSLLKKGDTYILDELIHRSVIDGCRLSNANRFKFKHNDMVDLGNKIKQGKGNVIVVVESLYSMDGDFADLVTISAICKKYNAHLIVDEAHSMGVFGYGLSEQLGLQKQLLACVKTYGKAMGVQGAVVLSSRLIRDYLINFASSFIFSTGISNAHVMAVSNSYLKLEKSQSTLQKLQSNIDLFLSLYGGSLKTKGSPIQVLFEDEVLDTTIFKKDLIQNKLRLYLVKSPSVAKDKQRYRICIHANHKLQEIELLCKIINKNLKTCTSIL